MFMSLLAGFSALLYRYTNQEDMVVGTLAPSGRKRSEVQNLMGYFLNPVPLRMNLCGNPTFRELLQRARDEAHRFGLAYNRQRRTTRTITSELLNIPGVGPNRRRQLLERFGSLAGVKSASVAELATVPGFSARLAERVLSHLNAAT